MKLEDSLRLAVLIREVLIACGCSPDNTSHGKVAETFLTDLKSVIGEAATAYGSSIHALEQQATDEAAQFVEQVVLLPLPPDNAITHQAAANFFEGSGTRNTDQSTREISEAVGNHIHNGCFRIFTEAYVTMFSDSVQAIGTPESATNNGVSSAWAMSVLTELARKLGQAPPQTPLVINFDPPKNLRQDILSRAFQQASPQLVELLYAATEIGFDEGYAIADAPE